MGTCILCPRELNNESPEHIILNAFGGKKKTTQVICTDCNLRIGNQADKLFVEDFELFLNAANISSGTGDPPKTLRNIELKDGTKIDLAPGFRPIHKKVIYKRKKSGEKTEVHIGVPTLGKLAEQFRNFASGVEITPDQFMKAIQSATIQSESTYIQETIKFSVPIGGRAQEQSIAKAALVLWALCTSNDEVRGSGFEATRTFVNTPLLPDAPPRNPWIVIPNIQPLPFKNSEKFAENDFSHTLAVWSDENGCVVGFYQLFGKIGYSIRLSEKGGSHLRGIILKQNPVTGDHEFRTMTPEELIPCDWVSLVNFTKEVVFSALENLLKTLYKKMNGEGLDEMLVSVIGEDPDRNRIITKVEAEKMVQELINEVHRRVFGGTKTRTLSGEEVAQKLDEIMNEGEDFESPEN